MDLIDYVASLPPIKIARLYENPFTCLAVFRSLAPLAKHYVLNLLFAEGVPQCKFPTSQEEIIKKGICDHTLKQTYFAQISSLIAALIRSWAEPSAHSKHSAAIDVLTRLQVLSLPGKSVEPAYCLSKSFCQHLRHSACSGTESQLSVVPEDVTSAAPAKVVVDDYAATQWEVRKWIFTFF
jgi:hypothetical protein